MAKTYRTIQGDMWDLIALKTMGSEYHMDRLMDANSGHLGVAVFPAGIILTIPDVPVKTSLNLPPWKRGGAS